MHQIIFNYFANDPLKLLYLLGGTGGLHFWYSAWFSRIRVEFKINNVSCLPSGNESILSLQFTCRNIGAKTTSIQNFVEVENYTSDRKPKKFHIEIDGNNLDLPPHQLKEFHAQARVPAGYLFSLFHAYKIKTTVGSDATFYSYRSYNDECNRLKRDWGAFKFKYFDITPRNVK